MKIIKEKNPKHKAKQKKRILCKVCKSKFTPRRKQTICSEPCKAVGKMFNSAFGGWLLDSVRRTGFLDCIKDVSIADLYLQVYKTKTKFAQYSGVEVSEGDFRLVPVHKLDIAHLYPCKGSGGYVGKLSPSNLVVSPRKVNQQLQNKIFNIGEKVLGITPVPSGEARLKRLIIEFANIDGLEQCTFRPKGGDLECAFPCRSDSYTLQDLIHHEEQRLGLMVNAQYSSGIYRCSSNDPLHIDNAYKRFLSGDVTKVTWGDRGDTYHRGSGSDWEDVLEV